MADPFPVDPPDAATASAPESSPVPHDDVHAGLADALGLPEDAVHDDPNDLPLTRPFSEVLAERAKKAADLANADPFPEQRTQTRPPFDGNPSWAGEAIPSKPASAGLQSVIHGLGPDEGGGAKPDYTGENDGPQPPPAGDAFRKCAELSQRIKRVLKVETSGFPDAEIEGFHIAAQMMAKIITGSNGDQRLLWMQLAKHCDDVAAALR